MRFPYKRSPFTLACTLALGAALGACGGDGDDDDMTGVAPGDVVALTVTNRIVSFDRAAPATLVSSVAVSGLASGEQLLGIDIRPADGLLYGLTSSGRILTIDAGTGAVVQKATLRAAAGDAFSALVGTSFGVDFNPVADRLRLVGDTGQNLRINVDTGDTISDGAINGAASASVSASAYTNAFAGTSTTVLYALDTTSDALLTQSPPNAGTLALPVGLGVDVTATSGFDIDAVDNRGYAALTVGGTTSLYAINLAATAAPAATLVAAIGGGEAIRGLALRVPTAPMVYGLSGTAQVSVFTAAAPATVVSSFAVADLAAGESVLGIDFRPADGRLYALTSTARVLSVDTASGASTLVSTLKAAADDTTQPYAGLVGTVFSVDRNPVADRLRVISDTGASLRINVATGDTTTDGTINRTPTPPSVVAAAYGNSFAVTPAGTTTLYDIDAVSDVLALQTPPNDGTLVDVGSGLGLDVSGPTGFDIAGGNNGLALAAVGGAAGPTLLYNVGLATGTLTLRGTTAALATIGGTTGAPIRDIAIRLQR